MTEKKFGLHSLGEAIKAWEKAKAALREKQAREDAISPDQPQGGVQEYTDIESEMIAKARVQTALPQPDSGRPSLLKHKHDSKKLKVKTPSGVKPKMILRGPGLKAIYENIVAQERAAATLKQAKAAGRPRTDRRELFDSITELVGRSSPRIEPRPAAVSEATRCAVEAAVALGANQLSTRREPDLENGFLVGFDFGTSSIKVAVRQPYQADDPVKAMPAPTELRSIEHPYLWQTALWFDPESGQFSLIPRGGFVPLEGFKTGTIGGQDGARVLENLPVTRAEATVAFLALHLAHLLGWYQIERPLAPVGGDHFLGVHIGIPVAAHDDQKTYFLFKRIVAAANALAIDADNLTHQLVRETYARSPAELPPGYALVPELAAAIAGYAADITAQPGSHILVDVGASTLDIVAFNLVDRERIAVFSAAVELLGAAALDVALSAGVDAQDFKRACDEEFEVVYGEARSPHRASDGFHPALRRRPVRLLTTGGGCQTSVHRQFIDEMIQEAVLGSGAIVSPTPPEAMLDPGCASSRLLLAYGLTRDIQELLELKLPSQVPSIHPQRRSEPHYIGPEMT